MSSEVRLARRDELDAIVRALTDAGFGPYVGRLVRYPWEQPSGAVIVAPGRRRKIHGAACCASFGATGWIGALGVVPRHRDRGIGSALTDAAVAWLRDAGATSVLLYATDEGRPIYERAGFASGGRARAWRGSVSFDQLDRVRPLHPGDRAALRAVDRNATAEGREAMLDAIDPLRGYASERDGRLSGYLLESPWGAGPAVLADDPQSGIDLLAAARGAASHQSVLTLPDANAAAVGALQRWGYTAVNHAERMCLGPPPAWRPERVFGMFNLFWG